MTNMKLNKKSLMGIFIVTIMILSVFGFMLGYQSPTAQNAYNEISFVQTQSGWAANIAGMNRFFRFHPLDVETVNISDSTAAILQTANTVIVSYNDSNDAETLALAQFYVEQTIGDVIIVVRGLTTNSTSLPQLTCKDGMPKQPVIMLKIGSSTSLTTDGSCIIVEAESTRELFQILDRIQYILLGVMNG